MNNDNGSTSAKSKPTLIFIETTIACDYRCRHCRASTESDPRPDQLTTDEMKKAIDGIKKFGAPYPMVIFTGGNFLMRDDMREIIKHTHDAGIPFSLSPSGSSLLTPDFLNFSKENNASSISLSIDGGDPKIHDWIRRNPGSFSLTISVLRDMHSYGIPVQINTTVMKKNVKDLPYIAKLIKDLGIDVWEVFFLIKTGRGLYERDLDPQSMEDVNAWLASLEDYGITVRTVESPMIKRIIKQKREGKAISTGTLFEKLTAVTVNLFGEPVRAVKKVQTESKPRAPFGLMFIAQNGNVFPDGFLPQARGNVKEENIADIYWNDSMFEELRSKEFLKGKCGYCDYKEVCGGSRARAYAAYHDPLAEDPACIYMPHVPEVISSS